MEASNIKAMREAVENALDRLLLWNYTDQYTARMALGVVNKLNAAISAPPRNCDVGTVEEQSERFDAHCRKHMGCLTCPLREKDGCVPKHCEFAWAQLPYEERGTNGK